MLVKKNAERGGSLTSLSKSQEKKCLSNWQFGTFFLLWHSNGCSIKGGDVSKRSLYSNRLPLHAEEGDGLDPLMNHPRNLAPLFILILALYTCLPLPAQGSIAAGVIVSTVHIFALALFGRTEESHVVWKKVLKITIIFFFASTSLYVFFLPENFKSATLFY